MTLEVRDPGRAGWEGLGNDVACFNSRLGNPSPRQLLSDAAPLPTTEPMPLSHTPRWGGVLEDRLLGSESSETQEGAEYQGLRKEWYNFGDGQSPMGGAEFQKGAGWGW